MRTGRSPQLPGIAAMLVALFVVALGLARSPDRLTPDDPPIRRVEAADPVDPPAPTGSAREAEQHASSSASPAAAPRASGPPSQTGGAATAPPVFDLATLAARVVPEPTPDADRFRTGYKFTPDDLAHPERYFEAAAHMPELRRDEERHDVLDYFLAYRAHLERELRVVGRDARKRAAVRTVIARYDAAIARLRGALAATAP